MRAHLCPLAVVLCFFGFPFCADFNHKSGLRFCRPAHHPHSSRLDHQRRRGKYDPGSKSWNFTARKTPRAQGDLSSKHIKNIKKQDWFASLPDRGKKLQRWCDMAKKKRKTHAETTPPEERVQGRRHQRLDSKSPECLWDWWVVGWQRVYLRPKSKSDTPMIRSRTWKCNEMLVNEPNVTVSGIFF